MTFEKWFQRLLLCAMDGEIVGHPLGSCLERDVLRDRDVQVALRNAYDRIVLKKTDDNCKWPGCLDKAQGFYPYCERHHG